MTTHVVQRIVLLMLPIHTVCQCRFNKTEECVTDPVSWRKKSAEFNCQKGNYTCLFYKEYEGYVETCIINYQIPPNTIGCPFINSCNRIAGPTLIDPKNQKTCSRVIGCPPSIHSGYSILEIYKYPSCITTEKGRTTLTTPTSLYVNRTESTEEAADSNTPISLIVGLTVAFVLIGIFIAAVVVYRFRRQQKSRGSRHMLNENEQPLMPSGASYNSGPSDVIEETNGLLVWTGRNTGIGSGEVSSPIYVQPSAAFNRSMRILLKNGILTLIGISGSGKSTLALDLMKSIRTEHDKSLKSRTISRTEEWDEILKCDATEIILIEDIFGKINSDPQKIEKWSGHLDSMISKAASKEIYIILTCRSNVKKETDRRCMGIAYDKMFKADLMVNLSDKDYCMSAQEMKSLLAAYSRQNVSRELDESDCNEIINLHYHDIGFPQLVTLYFSSSKFKKDGVSFFRKGEIALKREVRELDTQKKLEFSILAFMSSNEGYFLPENDEEKYLDFHYYLHRTSVKLFEIKSCLEEMKNTYVQESKEDSFCFQHETVFETVLEIFGEAHPDLFLQVINGREVWQYGCSRSLVCQSPVIYFEKAFYPSLANRLITFTEGNYGKLVEHRASQDCVFLPYLLDGIEFDTEKISDVTKSKRSYDFIFTLVKKECDQLINACILRIIEQKTFYEEGLKRCLSDIFRKEDALIASISTILRKDIPFLSKYSKMQKLIMNCSVEFIMKCSDNHLELITTSSSHNNGGKNIVFLSVDRAMDSSDWQPSDLIRHLLDMKESTLLTDTNSEGHSPAAYALEKSCFHLLNIILDYKPNIKNDRYFTFSLQKCVRAKNIGLLRKIISQRPQAVHEIDNNMKHPLQAAAEANYMEAFDIIWKACHSSLQPDLLLKLLETIIKNGWVPYLEQIIEKKKDIKNCRLRGDETPLILSAKHKQLPCIVALLEKSADIFLFDKNQRSFLHFLDAPDTDELENVFSRVEKDIDIVFTQDKNGISPLLQAVFSKRRNIATRLLDIAKSDKGKLIQDIRRKDKYDRTMLRESISNGWIDITNVILEMDPEAVKNEDTDMLQYVEENVFGEKKEDIVQIIRKCI